jgi:hypothetical protein
MGDSIARWEATRWSSTPSVLTAPRASAIPGGGFRTSDSHLVERYRLMNNGGVLVGDVHLVRCEGVSERPHLRVPLLRAPASYEAQPPIWCDPFDEGRAAFLTGSTSNGAAPARVRGTVE